MKDLVAAIVRLAAAIESAVEMMGAPLPAEAAECDRCGGVGQFAPGADCVQCGGTGRL